MIKSNTPEYKVWIDMRRRCNNSDNNNYQYYGARGITVCDSWNDSFDSFLEDMGLRPTGLTLERKDNEEGYYKENCKWASRTEQVANRRCMNYYDYAGQRLTLNQWAKVIGISSAAIHRRNRKGLAIEDLLASKSK